MGFSRKAGQLLILLHQRLMRLGQALAVGFMDRVCGVCRSNRAEVNYTSTPCHVNPAANDSSVVIHFMLTDLRPLFLKLLDSDLKTHCSMDFHRTVILIK